MRHRKPSPAGIRQIEPLPCAPSDGAEDRPSPDSAQRTLTSHQKKTGGRAIPGVSPSQRRKTSRLQTWILSESAHHTTFPLGRLQSFCFHPVLRASNVPGNDTIQHKGTKESQKSSSSRTRTTHLHIPCSPFRWIDDWRTVLRRPNGVQTMAAGER